MTTLVGGRGGRVAAVDPNYPRPQPGQPWTNDPRAGSPREQEAPVWPGPQSQPLPGSYGYQPAPPTQPSPYAQPYGPAPSPPRSGGRKTIGLVALAAVAVLVLALIGILVVGRHNYTSTTFTDPNGRYSIGMGGTPKVNSSASVNGATAYTYQSGPRDGVTVAAYSIPATTDVSDSSAVLKAALDGGVSAVSGTSVNQQTGTYQGHPSLDATLTAQQGSVTYYVGFREVLDDHTLFVVEVDGSNNPPAGFTEVANSLKIIKP